MTWLRAILVLGRLRLLLRIAPTSAGLPKSADNERTSAGCKRAVSTRQVDPLLALNSWRSSVWVPAAALSRAAAAFEAVYGSHRKPKVRAVGPLGGVLFSRISRTCALDLRTDIDGDRLTCYPEPTMDASVNVIRMYVWNRLHTDLMFVVFDAPASTEQRIETLGTELK
jgi:hypothetical protein